MYRVAVVEDQKEYQELVQHYISQYSEEHKISIQTTVYSDGDEIVADEENSFDLIFFDIEMEHMNGMEAAKKIRERDQNVVIIFITNMAQYAIEGYSVGALDFVLKPINYYAFSLRLTRAIGQMKKREAGEIVLTLPEGMKRLDTKDIYYIEIESRMLHYYTKDGEYVVRGTMQSMEEQLRDYNFVKCNHWYLVNLMYVTEIRKNIVIVSGQELEISRRNKSAFVKAVTEYIGGGF